jgi:hypothetical protein
LEFRESLAWLGAAPDEVEIRPPRWFIQEEIGCRFDAGPSLMWNCTTLARTNRAALKQLGTAAPDRVTYPKDFSDPRGARRLTIACRRAPRGVAVSSRRG